MTYIRLLIISLMTVLATGCVKDDLGLSHTPTEVPITASFRIGALPSPEISVTRANNSLSTIYSLTIFVFNSDGTTCQQIIDLNSSDLTYNGSYSNNETIYGVTFRTTSGAKKLLAVANYQNGGYWNADQFTALRNGVQDGALSFTDLRDGILELTSATINANNEIILPSITASSQMLISGWNEVVFANDGTINDFGSRGDASRNIALKMERAMARVTFNIPGGSTTKNVQNDDGSTIMHTVTFTPSTFRVYNFPKASYLGFTSETNTLPDDKQTYLTSSVYNISTNAAGDYTFSFYMPENIQNNGSATSYNQRDQWNYGQENGYTTAGPGLMPENKTWTHAPQYSTFVVINGTYEENTPNGPLYTATVEYTVHLGDFSADKWSNFSIVRNYLYTYNMSVLGVDNIIVEAHKGVNDQQGAEGEVYDASSCVYNYQLDSHFEQVFLQYNLSEIANSLPLNLSGQQLDDAISSKLFLVIQSAAMNYTDNNVINNRGSLQPYKIYADALRNNQDTDKAKHNILDGDRSGNNGFDYKWVEFWPQTQTIIADYPGVSEWSRVDLTGFDNPNAYGGTAYGDNKRLLDAYDICVAMGLAIKKIYLNQPVSTSNYAENGITLQYDNNTNSYVARFTAFVNEYYYYRHPLTDEKLTWGWMVNKIPREMIIAMSSNVSDDGNSIYSQIHSYISQTSMQSFYNTDASGLNAFGLETYNETPLSFTFMPSPGSTVFDNDLTATDGRSNQIVLLGGTNLQYESYGNWSTYINQQQNGYYSTVSTNHTTHKLSSSAYTQPYVYSACMSRNRDLNGNGKIDNNEVRWYLASTNEYIRIGIGANVLSSGAQLYIGAKNNMNVNSYPSSYISSGALFYTSSPSSQRVYWAVERGSYGGVGSYGPMPFRCLRLLPATNDTQDVSTIYGYSSDPTYEWDQDRYIFKFQGRIADELFRQYAEGPLVEHDEDDQANAFYKGIYVARNYIGSYVPWQGFVPTPFKLRHIVNYNSLYDNPCESYSETGDGGATWRVPNLVEFSAMVAAGLLDNATYEPACCTQFSNQNVRMGFAYSSLVYCPNEEHLKSGGNIENFDTNFKVRCVRDVPDNEL